MDPKAQSSSAAADRVYEDFVPPFEWTRDGACDKLVLVLPGFRREQLKVQLTSKLTLRISAERPLRENIWRRFSKEFPLFPDSDTNQISARFEGIRLSVMIPKTTPQADQPLTMEEPTQKAGQEVPSDSRNDREAELDANKAKAGELNNEGSKTKPNQEHGGKIMRRLKTRVVETLSLRASERNNDKKEEKRAEAAGDDLVKRAWKLKKLMSLIVAVIMLVLILGLFVKNTITLAPGGFKFQEL